MSTLKDDEIAKKINKKNVVFFTPIDNLHFELYWSVILIV